MSNQNILFQNIPSDLVVELSIEEQQLLSGGLSRSIYRPWRWRPRRRW